MLANLRKCEFVDSTERLYAFPLVLSYFPKGGDGVIVLLPYSFVVEKMLDHEPFFRFSDTSRRITTSPRKICSAAL